MTGAVRHGGALDRAIARHGGRREEWLDLSTGINPVAYPVAELSAEIWHRLPDEGLMEECLEAARACYGVPDGAAIVAAPGTQAIIQWLPVLFNYLDRAAIVSPTYGEYEHALRMTGVHVDLPGDLPADPDGTDLLIVGQPNNPDGRTWPVGKILPFAQARRVAVVDEAFADVAPDCSLVSETGRHGLLVLRSFGKFFGLAGLRLGFAIGDPDVVSGLAQMIGPWAVSGPALAIGARALRDEHWITETRSRLAGDSGKLATLLERQGMRIVGRTDLFVTAHHPSAHDLAEKLAGRHILVRVFDHETGWIRFGLPSGEGAFERLNSALAEIGTAMHNPA
ncbi:MAG: threonine-phosphate decarboxylase [Ahrensia sp.]|nr:threonine-phosphate decarboxylase [Ahrensia sp.]